MNQLLCALKFNSAPEMLTHEDLIGNAIILTPAMRIEIDYFKKPRDVI